MTPFPEMIRAGLGKTKHKGYHKTRTRPDRLIFFFGDEDLPRHCAGKCKFSEREVRAGGARQGALLKSQERKRMPPYAETRNGELN